jgi:hypothetical protein
MTMTIKSETGRPILVKLLHKGDAYGLNKCLTWEGWGFDKDELGIEFYDATYANQGRFDPEGQFVSRYYLSSLMEDWDRAEFYGRGLILHGGVPEWNISATEMDKVKAWVLALV